MPYPRWLAQVNKRFFNPREVSKGQRPVVIHWGRSSGRMYQTPVDAYPTVEGYVLVVRYGTDSDWVRNALAADGARLRVEGEEVNLDTPRLVSQAEALGLLAPGGAEPAKDFFKAEHYLLMDRSE
jgi:deazaflavin-dependent oxidoreductase (nitroreductase family)